MFPRLRALCTVAAYIAICEGVLLWKRLVLIGSLNWIKLNFPVDLYWVVHHLKPELCSRTYRERTPTRLLRFIAALNFSCESIGNNNFPFKWLVDCVF